MKVRVNGKNIYLWCPACEDLHMIDDKWSFNNDLNKPTITPSILTWIDPNPNVLPEHDPKGIYRNGMRCHSFVTDGQWHYLGDCTHKMTNQVIDIVEIPDGIFDYSGIA